LLLRIRVNAIAPGFFLAEQNRALLTNPDGSLTARGETIIKNTPFARFGSSEELVSVPCVCKQLAQEMCLAWPTFGCRLGAAHTRQ